MIVDGKVLASEILTSVRGEVEKLEWRPKVAAITVAPNPATLSYLKIKRAKALEAGMELEVVELGEQATTDEVVRAVADSTADAIIVQLPLPSHIDTQIVVDSIPLHKDADVLSQTAYARFEKGEEGALVPPVASAIQHVLECYDISYRSADVAIVGEGKLVGKPVATLLRHQGANVTALNSETFASNSQVLKNSRIIISGVGRAGLITSEMLGNGQVLIDAGTSESAGSIAGDFDPACAEHAALFTPVPGGVGPIAVACLYKNIAVLLHR